MFHLAVHCGFLLGCCCGGLIELFLCVLLLCFQRFSEGGLLLGGGCLHLLPGGFGLSLNGGNLRQQLLFPLGGGLLGGLGIGLDLLQPVFCLPLGFAQLEICLPAVFLQCLFGIQLCLLGLLAQGGFRFQLCLGIQLRLSHFFHNHLSHFYIGNVVVGDDFLLHLLDELGLDDLALLRRDILQLPGIGLQKTFEHGVVGDKVGEQLQLVFFVEFQGRFPLLNGVANLVIIFQKLPQLQAGAVVRVFCNQVCALDGTAHLGAAGHKLTECASAQCHDHAPHRSMRIKTCILSLSFSAKLCRFLIFSSRLYSICS